MPPNVLTQAISVSGMVIKSQLFRKFFFAVFKAMNLYPHCTFPLGPRKIYPLVLGTWLLYSLSYSWTRQYFPIQRRRWFFQYRVSPEMMFSRLRLSDIPPFAGNKFSTLTEFRTMWVVRSFWILWNGRPRQVDLHRSFTTLIFRSISGTCSFYTARFTSWTPGRYSIKIFNSSNLPSACIVVMWKRQCR